jgi:hypothetical protein
MHTLPGADIDSDHNLLVDKICARLKNVRFQKRIPRWDVGKLYTQRQIEQDTLEEKLGAIGSESGNVEVQWNKIKECVLCNIRDLVGIVQKRARKPRMTKEMISKMDETRKWKNVNTEEDRKNKRRLRTELKRATNNAKKQYLENICKEIMEYQRRGLYDLMYMKTDELGWKETQGIQNIGIEDSQENRSVEQNQVLNVLENCFRNIRST